MTTTLQLAGLLPAQMELARCRALLIGCFGGWGSGKTRGAAVKFLLNCLQNPWTPEYGPDRPFSIVVGPTRSVLRDSAFREFKAVCPPQLIRKETTHPDWEITLLNGHRVVWRTFKGMTEGGSACALWADEVHLVRDKAQWLNYQARVRDMRARRRLIMASGLPEHGWLQEVFDGYPGSTERVTGRGAIVTAGDGSRVSMFLHAHDNPYIPEQVKLEFERSTSASEARKYIAGRWQKPEGLVYHQLDHARNIIADPGDRGRYVHVGFDVGDLSHVVFAQPRRQTGKGADGKPYALDGLHIVDDFAAENVSGEELCQRIRDRGWLITAARSSLFTDPTIRRDEINAIIRVFPEIPIVKKSRKGKADSTEAGYSAVNAALRNAQGQTRLTFSAGLERGRGSLLWSMGKFKRKANGWPDRDNVVDHSSDALRYPVSHLLGSSGTHSVRART